MPKLNPILTLSSVVLALQLSPAGAQQPAAAQTPMPGTPGLLVSGQALAELMKAAVAKSADPAVVEVAVTDQYAIHEVRRLKAAPAAIHMGWTEVHEILEGGGTLVTGGKIVAGPGGLNTIEGGVSHVVKKGDVFIIPANTPHMYAQVDGTLTYFEMRFIRPDAAGTAK